MPREGSKSGVESLTPPIGLMTALLALAMPAAAIYTFIKHPKVFIRCLLAAFVGGALFFQHGDIGSHPLIVLLMLFVGMCCAGSTGDKKK